MFSKVQPKKYQVDVVHKVATEWYSGYRLVCVKLDGSRNTTPWQPCEQPQCSCRTSVRTVLRFGTM